MRTAYKVLAYLVAAEVAVQAMVMVWGIAGLGKWVDGGGVFDKAVIESEGTPPFPEVAGIIAHGINGFFVIPGTRAAAVDRLVLHEGARSDQVGRHRVRAGDSCRASSAAWAMTSLWPARCTA